MKTIPQQEAEDLAHSLPCEQSQSWDGAVFMVGAIESWKLKGVLSAR